MVTTVYFIRHADSDRNIHDDRSRPLTEKGLTDCCLVTNFLKDKKIDIILSSPYKRTVDTIREFAGSINQEIEIIEDFREREIGTWVEDITSFTEKQWADFSYKLDFPNSESLAEVQRRNISALNKIIKRNIGRNIVIGTHGNALAAILKFFDVSYSYDDFKAVSMLMPWAVKMEFDKTDYKNYEVIDLFRHSNTHTDIKIKTENEKFYYSVRGIIQQDGKYLVMQVTNKDNSKSSFHYPGGKVEIGEEAEKALAREIREEIGCNIKSKLFCVLENFWTYENTLGHGIELFFWVKTFPPLKIENCKTTEIDKGKEKKLEFKWLTAKELKGFNVRPKVIKEILINGDLNKVHHLVQRP
jgi:2,3-bisphosphoglycerate-dependent phosphoglycerate mutase